ncbi:MAG: hypothetical protein LH606_01840 [Cytophagaceae bacterium]|nr:hypothetical protein [Cytophagaceae bacterium]
MKSTLTLALCLLASRLAAQSGDSLSPPRHRQTTGFVEFGLLRNASLERLRDQLAPLGVTLAGTSFAPFGLQFYRRERRSDTEVRLWLLAGTGGNTASNLRLARLGGFGIGLAMVPRLVNTRRWVLGPVLGYDIVRYGLRIGAPTLTNPVPIQNVLANPLAHQSQVLRGTGITLNGGLAAG